MGKEDFAPGMSVFLYATGNAARGKNTDEERIINAHVKTVGRKYLTVELPNRWDVKFDIENNFREIYECGTVDYILYLSKEDIYKSLKRQRLCKSVEDFTRRDYGRNLKKLTDEELETIYNIIVEAENR